MMNQNEFFEYMRDYIRTYLPAEYADAEIELVENVKHNDVHLTALLIRNEEETMVPNIYLDTFFREYQHGMPIEDCLEHMAEIRVKEGENMKMQVGAVQDIYDYDKVKERLQLRLCDYEGNKERLQGAVYQKQGDFALTYYVIIASNEKGEAVYQIKEDMVERWGVDQETVHNDALLADKKRGVTLKDIDDVLGNYFYGSSVQENLLLREEPLDLDSDSPYLFVLSNESGQNGAGVLYQPGVMEKIADLMDGDYYVLPSSIHELMILPANPNIQAETLQSFVREINANKVDIEDQLSDKVQYYDNTNRVLVNAVEMERGEWQKDFGEASPDLPSNTPKKENRKAPARMQEKGIKR